MKAYNQLTKEEKHSLIKKGDLNWCGAKKGFDFDPYIELVEEALWLWELFDKDLKEEVCYPHDYKYLVGTTIIHRLKADFELWIDLYRVLGRYSFSFLESFSISMIITLVLFIKGGKAFNSK